MLEAMYTYLWQRYLNLFRENTRLTGMNRDLVYSVLKYYFTHHLQWSVNPSQWDVAKSVDKNYFVSIRPRTSNYKLCLDHLDYWVKGYLKYNQKGEKMNEVTEVKTTEDPISKQMAEAAEHPVIDVETEQPVELEHVLVQTEQEIGGQEVQKG